MVQKRLEIAGKAGIVDDDFAAMSKWLYASSKTC